VESWVGHTTSFHVMGPLDINFLVWPISTIYKWVGNLSTLKRWICGLNRLASYWSPTYLLTPHKKNEKKKKKLSEEGMNSRHS